MTHKGTLIDPNNSNTDLSIVVRAEYTNKDWVEIKSQ